jgi:RimJ/RimL family protein N-acetyltransferase
MTTGGVATTGLESPRLRLEPFTESHITDAYVAWLNDPEVLRYSELRHRRHNCESAAAYVHSINQLTSHLWAVVTKDGMHIGNISAHRDVPNRTAEIGILIGVRNIHGRGYGAEAWRTVSDWLFMTGIRKITAGTMAANRPMCRVFEKCGMVVEGRRIGQFLLDGRPEDLIQVALFRPDQTSFCR